MKASTATIEVCSSKPGSSPESNAQATSVLAVRGAVWTLGGYGSSQVIRLGSHLLLAWLLAPEVFGLMALVKVVQQGLGMFSDIGIQPAIIQNPRGADPEFFNTAWTLQIIRGLALWVASCGLAWPVAALVARNDPAAWQLLYLLPVVGFGAAIQGFNSTALATLNKELRLGRLTLQEVTSQIVSLTVMVGWALVSPSVWAMVAGGLAASVYTLIISHRLVPGMRMRLAWDAASARELLKFGRWIFLSTAFTFLAANIDKMVLGNVLTLGELGLYSMAFVFGRVALHITSRLSTTVLYPVYAKHRDDPERMIVVALRAREVVLWVGASACIALALGSPLFFETLWDDRYHGAGAIAQWASIYIWAMILMLTMDRIPLALGNSRALFVANVLHTIGVLVAIGGFWLGGLSGFIIGLAMGPVISHAYMMRHIPANGSALVVQGLMFTLGGAAYSCAALMAGVALKELQPIAWVSTALLTTAPLVIAGLVVRGKIGSGRVPQTVRQEVKAVL